MPSRGSSKVMHTPPGLAPEGLCPGVGGGTVPLVTWSTQWGVIQVTAVRLPSPPLPSPTSYKSLRTPALALAQLQLTSILVVCQGLVVSRSSSG